MNAHDPNYGAAIRETSIGEKVTGIVGTLADSMTIAVGLPQLTASITPLIAIVQAATNGFRTRRTRRPNAIHILQGKATSRRVVRWASKVFLKPLLVALPYLTLKARFRLGKSKLPRQANITANDLHRDYPRISQPSIVWL